jgi:acyl dehydratase
MPGWVYVDRYFEDYRLGESDSERRKTIDQSEVNTFAGLTLDFHPAHVDHTYAGPRYGGRIVHGMLTFAVVTGLCVEYNLRAISYGYEKVRFPNAVHPGDTVGATSEVVDLRTHRNPKIGLVVKKYTGTKQDGAVVFVCEHILAVDRGESTDE